MRTFDLVYGLGLAAGLLLAPVPGELIARLLSSLLH